LPARNGGVLADFFFQQITDHLMAGTVPMAIAEVPIKSMQKNFVFIGISLHRYRQIEEINLFTIGERLKPQVWIEEAGDADVAHKVLPDDHVRINLDAVAPGNHQEFGAMLDHFVAYLDQ